MGLLSLLRLLSNDWYAGYYPDVASTLNMLPTTTPIYSRIHPEGKAKPNAHFGISVIAGTAIRSRLLCPTLELVFGAVRSKLLHELVIEAQNQERWCPLAYEHSVFVPSD